jgi:hypothetical protein
MFCVAFKSRQVIYASVPPKPYFPSDCCVLFRKWQQVLGPQGFKYSKLNAAYAFNQVSILGSSYAALAAWRCVLVSVCNDLSEKQFKSSIRDEHRGLHCAIRKRPDATKFNPTVCQVETLELEWEVWLAIKSHINT